MKARGRLQGVALAAIQGLYHLNQPQEARIIEHGVKSPRQVYVIDPFGNRLELLELIGG